MREEEEEVGRVGKQCLLSSRLYTFRSGVCRLVVPWTTSVGLVTWQRGSTYIMRTGTSSKVGSKHTHYFRALQSLDSFGQM